MARSVVEFNEQAKTVRILPELYAVADAIKVVKEPRLALAGWPDIAPAEPHRLSAVSF